MTSEQSGLAERAQEATGAEYLATREMTEGVGLGLAFLERIGQIQRQQFEWFVEDYGTSFRRLGEMSSPFEVWVDHVSRRMQHATEGARQLIDAATRGSSDLDSTHRQLWSPFASLTGTRTAPGAPVEGNVIERLHTDHGRLARVLEVMERLGRGLEDIVPSDYETLISALDYVAEYPDAIHHPLEDRVFGRLLELDLSDTERDDVRTNAARHAELADATRTLQRDLDARLERSGITADEFRADIDRYVSMQREHMAFEESRVFPLAERRFTEADWQKLDREDALARDPLYDQQASSYRLLYRHVADG